MADLELQILDDVVYTRGDTFPCPYVNLDENGDPIDISTGYTYRAAVNRAQNPPSPTLTEVFEMLGTVDDGPNGLFSIRPAEADWINVTDAEFDSIDAEGNAFVTYYFDIEETNTNVVPEAIRTFGKGLFIAYQDVSK